MEKVAYLSLGSDLGDRESNLKNAIRNLSECCGKLIAIASVYETEPVGFISTTRFLNTCVALKTSLEAHVLLSEMKKIERDLGRLKKSDNRGYESRIIDIDIVFFGNEIIRDPQLIVPHPKYRTRNFVLYPLNDIASEVSDPVDGRTVKEILNSNIDEHAISIYKKDFYTNE